MPAASELVKLARRHGTPLFVVATETHATEAGGAA